MDIKIDDLKDGKVVGLLESHLQKMFEYSPPENVHALDHKKLNDPKIAFWSASIAGVIAGCGALKELSPTSGEIKSMKTDDMFLRKGVASRLLKEIIATAKVRGYETISLETGTHEAFKSAIKMYKKYGFTECGPFGAYTLDPHSCFFSKKLEPLKKHANI